MNLRQHRKLRAASAFCTFIVLATAANYYIGFGWFGEKARLVLSLSLLLAGIVIVAAVNAGYGSGSRRKG